MVLILKLNASPFGIYFGVRSDVVVQLISIKIPAGIFCKNWQADPKMHMEMPGTQLAKTILQKNKIWGLLISKLTTKLP